MAINPDEILDEILRFIYVENGLELASDQTGFKFEDSYSAINKVHMQILADQYLNNEDQGPRLYTLAEILDILIKLANDGHLRHSATDRRVFHTTFEGRWFIYRGGYVGRSAFLDAEKRKADFYERQTYQNAKMLNRLTVWIAIGTIVAALYYLLDIFEHHILPICSFQFWMAFYLLLSLTIAGLIVWLLVKEIIKQRSQG